MKFRKKEVILIIGLFVLIVLSIFMARYVGYVIQTTPSSVIIDEGIRVYADEFSGLTSDFLRMNDTELETIENMTLENTNYGKIVFSESVNLTQDARGDVINLDNNVEVSNNSININTSALTSLEKSATLYLYNLNFDNPRILRNGAVCPSSICQIIDYSGGTLEFTTTQFSNYSAEETPAAPSETPAPSGGGSSGGSTIDFEIEPGFITTTILQEEGKSFDLQIKNTGDKKIDIKIELQNLSEIAILSEENFVLGINEIKTINLNLFALSETNPKIYFGKLIIKGDSIEKIIRIIVEIKAREPLFDLKINVPQEYKRVSAGDEIPVLIQMENIGLYGKFVDVGLYIYIMDFDEKIFFESSKEMIAVKTNLSVVKELGVPLNAPIGKYLIMGKIEYDNITIDAYDTFDIAEKEFPIITSRSFVIILLLILFIFLIIYYIRTHYHIRKKKKRKNKALRN